MKLHSKPTANLYARSAKMLGLMAFAAFNVGCANANDAPAPEATPVPTKAAKADTLNKPITSDGKYDWRSSQDFDLLSPRLKEDFALMERMQLDVYNSVYSKYGYSKDFINFDLFDPSDIGSATNNRADLNYYKVACTTGVQLYRAYKFDNDSGFFGDSKNYREFAIECMYIGVYGKDETMRKACLAFANDYVNFICELRLNTKGTDPLRFLMFSKVKNPWESARIRIGHDGEAFSPVNYTSEKRQESVDHLFKNIEIDEKDLLQLVKFYKDHSEKLKSGGQAQIITAMRSDVLQEAINMNSKKDLNPSSLISKVLKPNLSN